jgi:hypothetical protein
MRRTRGDMGLCRLRAAAARVAAAPFLLAVLPVAVLLDFARGEVLRAELVAGFSGGFSRLEEVRLVDCAVSDFF